MSSASKLYLIKNTCPKPNFRQVFSSFFTIIQDPGADASNRSIGSKNIKIPSSSARSVPRPSQTRASLSVHSFTPSRVMRMQFGVSTLIGLPFWIRSFFS